MITLSKVRLVWSVILRFGLTKPKVDVGILNCSNLNIFYDCRLSGKRCCKIGNSPAAPILRRTF